MSKQLSKLATLAVLTPLGLALAGCQSNAGNGALIGGAGGAGVGALIGSYSHARAGEGALIGGAVGAVGGYIVGNEMDKQQARDRDRGYDRPDYRYAPPPPPDEPPPPVDRDDSDYNGRYSR